MRATRRDIFALALLAAALTLAVHHAVAGFYFLNDDYLVLRPWSRAELLSTLTGTWDPFGYNEPYHRPIEALLQAARFAVFGLNPRALHLLSLALAAGVATLVGVFVARETENRAAALGAAVLFIVHPSLPDAATAWIFEQMHLVACVLTMVTLLLWQRRRADRVTRWWPMAVVATVAFYLKEDSIMVLPAIVAAQVVGARLTRALPRPPRGVITGLAALAATLALIRFVVLPHLSAPGHPWWPAEAGVLDFRVRNLGYAPYHTLLRVTGAGRAGIAATVVLGGLLAAGVATALARARQTRWSLWIIGAALMVFTDLPQGFMVGAIRDHLVLLAAVLIFGGAIDALTSWTDRSSRVLMAVVMTAGAIALGAAAQQHYAVYQPCSAYLLDRTDLLLQESWLTPDLRAYLMRVPRQCTAGVTHAPVESEGSLMWGVGDWLNDPLSGHSFRWADTHSVALVRRDAQAVTLVVRHPDASLDAPVVVRIERDGGRAIDARLTSGDWREISVPLKASWKTRLRDSYRVDVMVTVPAGVVSRGVQLQAVRRQ